MKIGWWRVSVAAVTAIGSFILSGHSYAGDASKAPAAVAGIAIAAPSPAAGATPAAPPDFAYRIGVKPQGTSLHEIADALAKAANTKFPNLQLFEFEIQLGDYAGDIAAQLALRDFSTVARLARAGDQSRYIDAAWLPGAFGFATIGPVEFACVANGCEGLSGVSNQLEAPGLHPALRDWQIDRADMVRAIGRHAESFSDGLMMVTVTSAVRARTGGKTIGAGGAKSRALLGLPEDHVVVVVVGASHPCDLITPGEYWTGYLCGNYLVIDGVTGGDLDGGAYHEFHQVD
jgi:hypothetical protein